MATIDKSLPNTKTEIEIPGEEVIVEQQEKLVETEEGKETDITIEEDGSATVEFDPKYYLLLIRNKVKSTLVPRFSKTNANIFNIRKLSF